MKYSKIKVMSAFFILFAAGSLSGLVGAHPQTAHAAECKVTSNKDIDQLTAIKNDPTLNSSDEIKQELSLRKQLVGQTIACAQQEVQALRATLTASSTDSNSQPLQPQFLGRLDDAANYYSLESAKLDMAGIAGTQAIAKEVLTWRTGTFIPLGENVDNFILWSQNQTLFDTAQTRLDQTKRAVSFIESAVPNNDLQNALNVSMASFNDASSKNAAAKAALSQGLSPDQSLGFIKKSLDSLSVTYLNFFTVSTLIKKILPQ
jgi:hypothetical protein